MLIPIAGIGWGIIQTSGPVVYLVHKLGVEQDFLKQQLKLGLDWTYLQRKEAQQTLSEGVTHKSQSVKTTRMTTI